MAVYCVSYDLRAEKNYDDLYDYLQTHDNTHALESTWFIDTEKKAKTIRDELKDVIDNDDQVIVIEVTKHWASFKLPKKSTTWLKNR